MKVVVGLGNPGRKYEGTRHNLGFDVLAELSRRWGVPAAKSRFEALVAEGMWGSEKVLLVAPQTFMNLSGRSVQPLMKFFQLPTSSLLVVVDDLNLKTGQIRVRAGGSAGGQKGLQSILSCLGTSDVCRLRIGVGRPPDGMDPADYVLGRFRKEELDRIDAAIPRAANAVETWVSEGAEAAMNKYNGEGDPAPV